MLRFTYVTSRKYASNFQRFPGFVCIKKHLLIPIYSTCLETILNFFEYCMNILYVCYIYILGAYFFKFLIEVSSFFQSYIRSVNTWFPESANIWRYALWRGSMNKSFFIALFVCEHFCFSSFHLSLTWFAVADPPFIVLSLPPQFSVTAIPWNRLPKPWKA